MEYSGKGRKPKRCDEHKRNRSSSTSVGTTRNKVLVDRAVTELTMLYGMAGQGIKVVQPVIGEAVYDKREALAESYRMLLETDARFRKLFASMESKAAWLPIIAVHGDLIASIWIAFKINAMEPEHAESV